MKKLSRVRYKKEMVQGVETLVSTEFIADGKPVRAIIYPSNGNFWAIQTKETSDSQVVTLAKGSAVSPTAAKYLIKDELKKLGVLFNDEVRRKKEVLIPEVVE